MPLPLVALVLGGALGALGVPALGVVAKPALTALSQTVNRVLPLEQLTVEQLVEARKRRLLEADSYFTELKMQGLNEDRATMLFGNAAQQLPPELLIVAFRRGILSEDDFRTQMHMQGFSDERINTMLEATLFFPSPSDMISWISREVFEPQQIENFGLLTDFNTLDLTMFRQGGISEQQVKNFWIAHWEHPAWTMIQRFRHYDVIDDSVVKAWFGLVEMAPYWQQRFIETLFEPYTRVDLRRMWELGVLDDDAIVDGYRKEGYSPEAAQNLLVYTKLERTMPTLSAQFKLGQIGEADVRRTLAELGVPPQRVDFIAVRILKQLKPERLAKEKDLTKAEIVKAVKRKIISREQAVALFKRMGYDDQEASILMRINFEAVTGSPESFFDLLDMTDGMLSAEGKDKVDVPDMARQLEAEYWAAKRAYDATTELPAAEHTTAAAELFVRWQAYNNALLSLRLPPEPNPLI